MKSICKPDIVVCDRGRSFWRRNGMHSQSQTFCEENSTKNNQNSAAEKAGLYKARLYVWRCSFASQPLLERLMLCEKRWEQLFWFSTTRCFNEKMARLYMIVILALSLRQWIARTFNKAVGTQEPWQWWAIEHEQLHQCPERCEIESRISTCAW